VTYRNPFLEPERRISTHPPPSVFGAVHCRSTEETIRYAERLLASVGARAKVVRLAPAWKPSDVVVIRPYSEQFLTRIAEHMARGAVKYTNRNWEKAQGPEELARYKSSAHRHLMQWLAEDREEDHAAAVVFNLLTAETVR
jgi:hypothetical protein